MTPSPSDVEPAALFIVSGPSCSGKDTLVERLLEAAPELARPVTTTTRAPREHEEDGVHYHFVTEPAFLADVEAGEFVEHARVHGNLYGLTRRELDRIRATDHLPVVILDVQGAASVAEQLPTASVFIDVPTHQLAGRMREHRPENEVQARMASAAEEHTRRHLFDRVLHNPDGELESATRELITHYCVTVEPRLVAYTADRREARSGGRRR